MKIFKTSLFLLLPFLAMTEGGAMYQRLVVVPLWLSNMALMKSFNRIEMYFLLFTPIVVIIWLVMIISSRKYKGRYRNLLYLGHCLYLIIILSTALYFIPALGKYVGEGNAPVRQTDYGEMRTWANWSLVRQIVGFAVIAIYSFILSINSTEKNYRQ